MLTRGDFHIHSTASDGSLSPWEIVVFAKNRGVDTIAIADHNSTNGIDEAAAAGRQYGVSVIPAVELSTRHLNERIHLLGYFRDDSYNHPTLKAALRYVKNNKAGEVRRMIDGLLPNASSREHLSIYEGMKLLQSFGASVVLAHPARIRPRYLEEVLNMPFDGIEAKYCNNSPYETEYLVNTAVERFSFYTAGSDFHSVKSHQMHCLIGDPSLGPSEIQNFLSNSGAAVLS